MPLCDGEHQAAALLWRERTPRKAARLGVHRPSRIQRTRERRGGFRLYADEANATRIPSGNPAKQPSTTDCYEKRIQVWHLLLEFKADRPLTQQRLYLIKGVDLKRPGGAGPGLARLQRICISFACHNEVRTALANSRDLGGRSHAWHEDSSRLSPPHGGMSNCHAVIAAPCSDHTCLRNFPQEEICKSPAGLGRPRLLKQFAIQDYAESA